MRRTLANLEKEERAIVDAYKRGEQTAIGMREHLNNIRKHALWEAVDGCNNFEQYVKLERLPFELSQAKNLAAQGEVEAYLPKADASAFSGKALTALSQIRQEGENGKRTYTMHKPRIQSVAKKCIAHAEKTGEAITGPLVKQIIESMPWSQEKLPEAFGAQCEKRIQQLGRLLVSLKQLNADVFLDAEDEYPGSVSRLAKSYSDLASLLRKVLR